MKNCAAADDVTLLALYTSSLYPYTHNSAQSAMDGKGREEYKNALFAQKVVTFSVTIKRCNFSFNMCFYACNCEKQQN
jgi:hypothetical protein